MYTQCPKCLTYFQVTAEHLKVAQGNVRCGQCSNVFSALGNLSEAPPQETPQPTSEEPSAEVARSPVKPKSPPPKTEAPKSAQSKLTSAIAAIQALNQSSQKILSQGRKNYVNQFQQEAKSTHKKKNDTVVEAQATARAQPPEQNNRNNQRNVAKAHDGEFDIEQALAAVDDIDINNTEIFTEENNAIESQQDFGDADEISAMLEELPLSEEDLAEALAPKNKQAELKKPPTKRILKKAAPENKNEFTTSDLKLPADDKNKLQPKKNTGFPLSRKQEAKPRQKPDASKSRFARKPAKPATKRPAVRQHVVAEPDVIIENNIPTLAIPKQLLEDFQEAQIHPAHYRSMITWGLLSLLLMLVFLGQAIYFKHNELGQVSQLRPYIEMFCRHASCELSMQSDIGLIELLGQDIRSHPKNKKALLVSATIINNAPFTQPYPGLRLSFSDMNGEKVAARNFLPKDYLPKKVDLEKGMETNIPIQIELDIVDPGKNAVNFEFDFFPI